MPNPRSSAFLERVRALPHFDYGTELDALVAKHGDGPQLVQAIIDAKLLAKDEACRYWADSMYVAYVDPFASVITDEAIERLPLEVARKAKAIGLYQLNGVLTVAMASPSDAELVRRLSQIAQVPISPVFALPREVEDAIAVHYSNEKGLEESLQELERSSLFDRPDIAGEKLAVLAENNALAQILDEIIFYAMRERATDIHVEPQETMGRIRYRIDGNLREILTYSRKLHRALISRIKILSNLNIAETRFPQDGRFSMAVGSQLANFRVSTIPSAYGEKSVVRILAATGRKTMLTLDKMMISKPILEPFKRLVQNPNGIIFVTGPTGSGKTTTLYAALQEINTPDINISTIEDPIEIQLPGVTQSQVNSNIDLKFATVLRALMRQDPDVILIGEIRDLETAKIATEAALTGHLVLATLHTNNAPQAIVRLLEIGVAPYMVAPSVIGVLAQRLAARICDACKEAYYPSEDVLRQYFHDEDLPEVPFFRGRGCPACRHTGYKGRIAFHELVLITDEIRTMISEGRSVQEITRAAAKVGYKPLRYDGLKKVLLGLTTIEEIEQNSSFEWATPDSGAAQS
ncbi:GspE/PulE family protein [Opitutus sp. ER46]|uniref:GspE/PulE family protein n=1 Tax=Opitutus sp. ER46 TaxID=2161864 RepID=UPI000D315BDF|nr:GspE/PulE family protein [Opitutus sp. ER46]PTX94242.1 type II/IV secretion system protein [Opitutus sp. ER46]